ncbi:GNAT family N-acetyltransferase [Paucibacter sp. JuS9]|uniref:GNAT family N-acetyltransferase n=1 Tax=Paucibacter sp. JuS9 TaxID=3228748 RepID=UPI003757E86B
MSGSNWSIHRLPWSLGEHSEAWDALRRRLFGPNPMLGSRFVNALLANFGTGAEHLCILTREGRVDGMCIVQRSNHFSWRSFLPEQSQLGPTLLTQADDAESLIQALPGLVAELDLLCCDPDFGELAQQSLAISDSVDQALTMSIELTGSFAEYWAARPKKLAQNLDRYRRRATTDGLAVRLTALTRADELSAAVQRYAELETAGWKGNQGTAVGSSVAQRSFYDEVMQQHASNGLAIAWELWHGELLVASRLAIIEDSTLVMLKTTYLESASNYAPGRELLRLAIEHCFGLLPGGRIEFYTDATDEQLKWSTGHRWIRHLGFYRNALTRTTARATRLGRRVYKRRTDRTASTNAMQICHYSHPKQFPPALLQFFSEAETQSIQFGVDWYTNLVDKVFQDHPGVKFYVMEKDGHPVAALPLLVTATLTGHRVQALANYYTALYAPLLSAGLPDLELAGLLKAVVRDHPGLSSFQFFPMATDARSFRSLLSALRLANLVSFPYFCFGNWYLSQQASWAAYLEGRAGKQRNTISRMGKKLHADGARVEVLVDGDMERGIRAYNEVYAASWKQPEPYLEFIPGLINCCEQRGWLRLGVVWLGEKPIAAQIWIVANDRADIYKVAYDEAYKHYSPGTVLTAALMKHVIDIDHVHEVDYLIGDDPYKQTWMSARRERWGIVAYNPLSFVGFRDLAIDLCRRSAKVVVSRLRHLWTKPEAPA